MLKVFAILILIVIAGITADNLLYYFTHHFNVEYLRKSKHNGYEEYSTVIDTYQCGCDMQSEIIYRIYPDSSGTVTTVRYFYKIDGDATTSGTYGSLLPYDKSRKDIDIDEMRMDSEYIYQYVKNDTVYVKYKIEDDKLYLDKFGRYNPYDDTPEWGFLYNSSRSFIECFAFWERIIFNFERL